MVQPGQKIRAQKCYGLYPFGLTFNSYRRENWLENKYKYNSVELNTSIGVYETMFRHYDPALGGFNRVDPLVDIIPAVSPYHFGFNNPVRFNDPLGLMGTEKVGADGLTNSQWMEASRPGASPGLMNQYREQNRARERETSHFNGIINNALSGNIDGLVDAGLTGYYTLDSEGYIYKLHVYDFGSVFLNTQGGPWFRPGDRNRYTADRLTSLSAEDLYGGIGITVGAGSIYYGVKGNVTHNELYWRQKNGTFRFRTAATKSNYLFNRSYNLAGKTLQSAKSLSNKLGVVGLGLTAYDIYDKGLNWTNGLDAAFGAAAFIPGVGWAVSGTYFVANLGTTLVTGKTIGANIEELLE